MPNTSSFLIVKFIPFKTLTVPSGKLKETFKSFISRIFGSLPKSVGRKNET
jgi:hypothetical protein